MSTPAADGRTIWEELKARGGLNLRRGHGPYDGYDVPLEDTLNAVLFPDSAASFEENLTADPKKADDFLIAFFRAQKPFSLMMTDVLGFFERASARYADENIRIVFDFDKSKKELAIDLQNFREWEQFHQNVTVERPIWKWAVDHLWQLTYLLVNFLKLSYPGQLPDPSDLAVRHWTDRARLKDWEDPPRIPASGDKIFDELVEHTQRLLDAYHSACFAISPYRHIFMDIGQRSTRELDVADAGTAKTAADIFALWQPETDFWAKTFTKAITVVSEQVALGLTPSPDFLASYQAALASIDRGSVMVEELREMLRELLSLPIWHRRHELYAVWVGSKIDEAMDDAKPVYHVVDGVLRFPFSGAHLATYLNINSDILLFWTELRSRLIAKSLVGRKNIQPDYRIVKLPFDPEKNTVLVVECKQYRRSSLSEFSNALNDYARGCHDAKVILVNNGPIGPGLTAKIARDHADRTHAIGNFRPDNPEALGRFRSLVRASIFGPEANRDAIPRSAHDGNAPAIIYLRWDARFADLDLIIRFAAPTSTGEHFVCFSNPGSRDEWPYLHLEKDVQVGPGEEIIRSNTWEPGTYDVFVHNYSDSRCPAQAGVHVIIDHPSFLSLLYIYGENIRAPVGQYWHVCKIDGASGEVQICGFTGNESILSL